MEPQTKGLKTFNKIKALMVFVDVEAEKFYTKGNKTACTRARRALDEISKLKIKWRREVLAA